MNKLPLQFWAVAALVVTGYAQADHCATNLASVQNAANQAPSVQPNVLSAVEALVPAALEACGKEELAMTGAESGSPMLAPDYVSVGQSMLINAADLLNGQ
ncbi:hypothetical protein TMS3_0106285 [Pseudomonas taeanensis MS-3]|uniref:Lipoprotein n=1 Tax=Pseudomonas taeanensis MS-3 TaxID=1395571 RepID=A0A0A1YQJ3_9PSED|nr:hypothetical protein [Pseudomonas taeanensis]KFX71531.1 hypothetical protein TMS3_0106285 [Pseudomonas taeanensis MS-3]